MSCFSCLAALALLPLRSDLGSFYGKNYTRIIINESIKTHTVQNDRHIIITANVNSLHCIIIHTSVNQMYTVSLTLSLSLTLLESLGVPSSSEESLNMTSLE